MASAKKTSFRKRTSLKPPTTSFDRFNTGIGCQTLEYFDETADFICMEMPALALVGNLDHRVLIGITPLAVAIPPTGDFSNSHFFVVAKR